jgi:hypothetical protein
MKKYDVIKATAEHIQREIATMQQKPNSPIVYAPYIDLFSLAHVILDGDFTPEMLRKIADIMDGAKALKGDEDSGKFGNA